MTAGEHFERVAVVYESLRTTDEAPVRAIGQLLPGRPVTGLDIGCGTGRYTRLLRAMLPGGSRLAAADVSAAMLAQLKAASQRHAEEVAPLLAAAEQLPLRAASLDLVTAFNCVHHFDLGRFLAAAARVLAPGGQLFIYTRTPQQNAARSGAATSPASPSTSSACTARTRSGTPSGGPAGSRWPPPRPSTTRAPAPPSGSRPRPRAGTTRPSLSTRRRSCVQPSLPSWPPCPAAKCPGSTSTSWSSPTGAATRQNPAAQPARRTRQPPARPPRSAPTPPARLPQDVPAAARRPPRNAPSRLLPSTVSRASNGGCARARARPWLIWPQDG